MELLRSHGITRDTDLMTHEPDGSWYYQQITLGFNYRMTEMQAALGASQIKRLSTITEKRHQLARKYDSLLADLPVITPYQHSDGYSGLHLYVIRIETKQVRRTHKEVFDDLRAANIGVNLHYIPVHLQPYYQQNLGFTVGDFPEAERVIKCLNEAVAGNNGASEVVVATRFWQRIGVDLLRGGCRAFQKRLVDKSAGGRSGVRYFQGTAGLAVAVSI